MGASTADGRINRRWAHQPPMGASTANGCINRRWVHQPTMGAAAAPGAATAPGAASIPACMPCICAPCGPAPHRLPLRLRLRVEPKHGAYVRRAQTSYSLNPKP
eukprot:355892-Chlamydomonas_euryale.AAC.6